MLKYFLQLKNGFGGNRMSESLKQLVGKELKTVSYKVDEAKIRELAEVLGETREEYLTGKKMLPTFPTVIEYWSAGYNFWFDLGLDAKKTLHGEQEYEYIGEIKVGDTITVRSKVVDVFTKKNLTFVILVREFFNQDDELVLRSKSTIIETE